MVRNIIKLNNELNSIILNDDSKTPIKYCSVKLSDVVSKGMRIDASVYDIEAKQAREIIEHGKYPLVFGGMGNLIKEAFYPGRFKRIYSDKGFGVPFFLPSQMTEVKPLVEKRIYALSKCNFSELKLKTNTLLLTRSGTIGTVSYVSQTIKGAVFSDDVIRVTFKDDTNLGYVYAFLKSKVGNKLLTTNGYGAVVTHIEPDHLSTIPIPDAPYELKRRINDLIKKTYQLLDESNLLIDAATSLMVNELHLPDINDFDISLYKKNAGVDTFSVRLSKIDKRFDASYSIPTVEALVKHLDYHAEEVTTVGDKRISKDIILPGRFKRVYVGEGYGRIFIGGKQILELDPSNKKYLSIAHHGDRIEKQLELHEGMTLITCSGTIGKVALVGAQWEKWTANQHIIRVIPANRDIEGYLYIFLSSQYGHLLISHYTYGSVVDEIDDTHVSSIPFPIMNNKTVQQQINELALEANEKRYQAYMIEQQALQMLDDEVIFAK